MAKRRPQTQPFEQQDPDEEVFQIEFKNDYQKQAYDVYTDNSIVFLLGAAGTGKTHLATAFAIKDILSKQKKKIVLTRPIVESGEKLGFLPGDLEEKINPYMIPIYDCLTKLCGSPNSRTKSRQLINTSTDVAPLAFMRGRSQPLSSKIYTPDGVKSMGEIKVGDYVLGSDGQPKKVLGVYPQGKISTYKVNFSDRTSTRCSADHLWSTMTLSEKRHKKGFTVKTTSDIMKNVKNKHNQKIHKLPLLSAPAFFTEKECPIHPYLLGVILGDGHCSTGNISISTADIEILQHCLPHLKDGHYFHHDENYDYSLSSCNKKNHYLKTFREEDLLGKKSYEKFIPDVFKYNSAEVRLDVLRGLLDTDGHICLHRSGNCRIQYYSTSEQLADDVMFLVRSLGGYAYFRKREFDENDSHEYNGHTIKHVHPCYVVDIIMPVNPFKLERKASVYDNNPSPKLTKLISSIEYDGEEECQCIMIESEDSLYLTDDFILTHNTFENSVCIFDEAQNATLSQLKLFLTRMGNFTKMVITGDPTQSDLYVKESLSSVAQALSHVPGVGVFHFPNEAIVRHPLVGAITDILAELEKK